MNILKKQYYLSEILRLKRGNSRGTLVNAKPIFILSLIESIGNGVIKENIITYPAKQVEDIYKELSISYEPWKVPSPFILPYYHMVNESYYHIKWKGDKFVVSSHAHSPSGRYLTENSEYAYLDQELWDLLQNYNVREEFRELIINFFIKPKRD